MEMTEIAVSDRYQQIAAEVCKKIRILPNDPDRIREFKVGHFSVMLIRFAQSNNDLRLLIHRPSPSEWLIVALAVVSEVYMDSQTTLNYYQNYEGLRSIFAGTIIPVLQGDADFTPFMQDYEHFSSELQELLDGSAPPSIELQIRRAA